MTDLRSPVNVSTKRTAVNAGVIVSIAAVVSKVTGWEIKLDDADLLIAIPVVTFIVGFGYRLSRAVTNRWPQAGWVLFGSGKEPAGLKKIN